MNSKSRLSVATAIIVSSILLFPFYPRPSVSFAGDPATAAGIPLDTEWKSKVYDFATVHAVHVAWGRAHSERNYLLANRLAEMEGVKVDRDVLFAATFLHDIGAIPPYRTEGVEHEVRSVEVMEPLLKSFGFPETKISAVRQVILEHMYYHPTPPSSVESKVFHDADALDFLGNIGIVRIASLAQNKHPWAPDLPGAMKTLKDWTEELPGKLLTKSAKTLADERIQEMRHFFGGLDRYTVNGAAL